MQANAIELPISKPCKLRAGLQIKIRILTLPSQHLRFRVLELAKIESRWRSNHCDTTRGLRRQLASFMAKSREILPLGWYIAYVTAFITIVPRFILRNHASTAPPGEHIPGCIHHTRNTSLMCYSIRQHTAHVKQGQVHDADLHSHCCLKEQHPNHPCRGSL